MQSSFHLLRERRFLPLFVTQFLGAFNDNLFKNAMVLFVVYNVFSDESSETIFSAAATFLFIIPFILLSGLAGKLADSRDKARLIRIIKFAEIVIMGFGAAGLVLAWLNILVIPLAIPIMLIALTAMGAQSTFLGPIKYAILPQHLPRRDVLGGTGLVEASTYLAILTGTLAAGYISVEVSAIAVIVLALIGYVAGTKVPEAPPQPGTNLDPDLHIWRSTRETLAAAWRRPAVRLAILSISLFWAVGSVLIVQFPPLSKNVLTADKGVTSMFIAVFSTGIAIGSVAINRLLRGKVSARYAPAMILIAGVFVLVFRYVCSVWVGAGDEYYTTLTIFSNPLIWPLLGSLIGIAIAGGMFVVPLYAYLTTTVPMDEAASTIGANNIINSLLMVAGAIIATLLSAVGISIVNQLLLSAVLCLGCSAMAIRLHRETCDMDPSCDPDEA